MKDRTHEIKEDRIIIDVPQWTVLFLIAKYLKRKLKWLRESLRLFSAVQLNASKG
jgi:hypothetical protein